LANSPDMEPEAAAIAVNYGINPGCLGRALKAISAAMEAELGYFSTHPAME